MLQITENVFYEAEDFSEEPEFVFNYNMTTGDYITQLHKLLDLRDRGVIEYQVIEDLPRVTINVCY